MLLQCRVPKRFLSLPDENNDGFSVRPRPREKPRDHERLFAQLLGYGE